MLTITRAEAVVASKDAPIVAGALSGHVDVLTTYDRKHLLNHRVTIERALKLRVATPEEALTVVEAPKGKEAA